MSLGLSTMSETTRIVHDKRPQENLDPVTGFRELGSRAICFQGAWENWKTFTERWHLREHFWFKEAGSKENI